MPQERPCYSNPQPPSHEHPLCKHTAEQEFWIFFLLFNISSIEMQTHTYLFSPTGKKMRGWGKVGLFCGKKQLIWNVLHRERRV